MGSAIVGSVGGMAGGIVGGIAGAEGTSNCRLPSITSANSRQTRPSP